MLRTKAKIAPTHMKWVHMDNNEHVLYPAWATPWKDSAYAVVQPLACIGGDHRMVSYCIVGWLDPDACSGDCEVDVLDEYDLPPRSLAEAMDLAEKWVLESRLAGELLCGQ